MDYARRQRDPGRHVIGIAFVVLVHGLVIYALVSGLARKAVEVIKKPITATIIEEIKAPPPPPPPPPPKKIVEQPKIEVPIQPYVPPPDIPPPPPMVEMPTITAVTPEPPPKQEYVIAPPPPPVVAPPAPPKPAVRRGISRISGYDPTYPREAIRASVAKGRVVVRLQIDEKGNVTDVIIVSSDPPRIFDRAVTQALREWKFRADGEKYTGEVEVNFTLKDE
ncbi:MAG: TonB family protein [Betaproteobacteria bacterium]